MNFSKEKEKLISQLIEKGITDIRILNAIKKIPREIFIPEEYLEHAYDDGALPIGYGQTISQPYTVAFMTEILDIKNDMKVLEIGTGSGYHACVLCELGADVYSIERIPELYEMAKRNFEKLGYTVHQKLGDGSIGWEKYAPFDRIIVPASAPRIPSMLIRQLKNGGKMVIPIGDREIQTMHLVTRCDETQYMDRKLQTFKFVPLIGLGGWEESNSKN
ncbi:MAG TPA: protein-L-isoaspartate(D-aspartate) O-methyltransferase [Candidatus Kapabacteria bacterium]|nr:protein-L-isoaspartate(D-aspartate) O-methyltransferase [Candidatus Kapabacteria bacterium]